MLALREMPVARDVNVDLFCPFFSVSKISEIIRKCGDIDTAVLAFHLKFKSNHNKYMQADGKRKMSLTRREIASYYGWGLAHTDSVIRNLRNTGLVKVTIRTANKRSKLFFEFDDQMLPFPIHITALHRMAQVLGLKEAALFSYLLYRQRNSELNYQDDRWAAITREEMATFLQVSKPTVTRLLSTLKDRGIITMENRVFNDQIQLHVSIPKQAHELLAPLVNQFHVKKEDKSYQQQPPATPEVIHRGCDQNRIGDVIKTEAVYIEKNKHKNNITKSAKIDQYRKRSKNEIRPIGQELTDKQHRYLEVAVKRTLEDLGKPELERQIFEEVKFNVLSPQQHKGIDDFLWVVNRAMVLIRNRQWKTPWGFKKYSEYGKRQAEHKQTHMEAHLAFKQAELAKYGRKVDERYLENF
jgi:DNA-binding MarR family transcriptional regulator